MAAHVDGKRGAAVSMASRTPLAGVKAWAGLGPWPVTVLRALLAAWAVTALVVLVGGWLLYQQRLQTEVKRLEGVQQAALENLTQRVQRDLLSQVDQQRRVVALAPNLSPAMPASPAATDQLDVQTRAKWLGQLKRGQALPYVQKIAWRAGQAAPMVFLLSDQGALVETGPSEALSALLRASDTDSAARGTAGVQWSQARGQSLLHLAMPMAQGIDSSQGVMLFEYDLANLIDSALAAVQPSAFYALLGNNAQVLWTDSRRAWNPGANLAELAPQAWQAISAADRAVHADAQWRWLAQPVSLSPFGELGLSSSMRLVSMRALSDMPTEAVVAELKAQTAWQSFWAWLLLAGAALMVGVYRVRRRGLRAGEEERLLGLINALGQAVILRGADGRVLQANAGGRDVMEQGFLQALDRRFGPAGPAMGETYELAWEPHQGQSQIHRVGLSAYQWGWMSCQLIVAQSETELALIKKQEAVAQEMLTALSMLAVFRGDCTLVDIDERLCQIFGRDRDELVGSSYRSLLFLEVFSSESFEASWARLVKGDIVNRSLRVRSPAGAVHDLDAVYAPEFGPGGHLRRVLCSVRDVTDLALAKHEGDKSQRMLEAVFQVSESALVLLDGNQMIMLASQRLGLYLDRESTDLTGEHFLKMLAPGERQRVQGLLQASDEGAEFAFELDLRSRHGQTRRLHANVTCRIINAQKYFALELTDQSQRERVRERLAAVQNLLDDSAMVLELDSQGCYVRANNRWLQRFSPLAQPDRTQVLWQYCPPGASVGAANASLIESEIELQDSAHHPVWVQAFASSTVDLASGQRNVQVLSFDISDSVSAKRQLSDTQQNYRMYLDLSLEGFLVVSEGGQVQDANPAACHLLGYTHHDLCGLKISEVDKGSTLAGILAKLANDEFSAGFQQFESVMRRSDMTLIPVALRLGIMGLGDERQYAIVVKDLSELQQQRRAMISLRTALNATHMVLELDEMGNFVTANQSFLKCFGRIEAECIGRPFRGFDKETVTRRSRAMGVAGAPNIASWEAEHRRFDKTSVWLRSTLVPIKVAAGQKEGFLILSSDITAAVLARQALEQEKALTSTYMESMPVGIFVHDSFGQFTEVNKAFCEMVGMTRQELISMSMFDLEVGISIESLTEMWASLVGEHSQARYEGVASHTGGQRIPWRINLAGIDVNGERRFLGGARDLTQERETESILERQTHALDVSHMVVRMNPEWKIVDANQMFLERFETSLAEVLGQDWNEFGQMAPYESSAAERRSQMKVLAAGRSVQTELGRLTKLRHTVWMLASYHAYLNPLGEMESITMFALDITDRKNADRRIGEAQKMEAIGELTGGLAHDFNNMLGIVLGNLEMMEPDLPQDDVVLVECFNAARQAATRGASVANSLLAVARRQNLDLARIDVNESLMSLIDLLRHSVGSNIRLNSQLCPGELLAMADSSGLSNVVLNLVINARDALNEKTAGAKHIQVASDRLQVPENNPHGLLPGSYALITVQDTGAGMTEEVRQRAFDPFFTTKAQGKGTGLGLATVRGFAEQLGGAVFIESALGQGTTVSLYLPLLRPESREYLRYEAERLAALQSLEILDTQPDVELDKLVSRAAELCNAKTALISLVDADRQWFKAKFGLTADQTPRRDAFCAHAIESSDDVFQVTDASDDSRFSGNPLVVGEPFIRFYAGVPLLDNAGHALGTLCVLDTEPGMLSDRQRAELRKLAGLAAQRIDARLGASPAEGHDSPSDDTTRKPVAGETDSGFSFGEGRSVLVVDDEEGLCRIARKWLEAMGFAVQTSTSAEEALVLMREQPFDVLFSDIVMPGDLDGPALAKKAKEISPGLQVVLTTGFSPEALDDLDGAKVLRKPYARSDVQAEFASLRFEATQADGSGT